MDNRWILVLGSYNTDDGNIELSAEEYALESLLSTLYGAGGEKGNLGKSSHKVRKWLEGIRNHFNPDLVSLMQQDALERQELHQMLLEPELIEKIEPDIHMVAAILSLKELLPDRTKASARQLVQKLVEQIRKKLKPKLNQSIQSSNFGPIRKINPMSYKIHWHRTIEKNLKHFQKEVNTIIPENWFGRKSGHKLTELVLLIDKSESMISSAVYASIIGSVLASLPSIKTHLIFFDTTVTDMTERYQDPVDILFSVPMGGGTDIGFALQYVRQKIRNPAQTILFLISDLDEGGPLKDLYSIIIKLKYSGLRMYSILSLEDNGKPVYNELVGQKLADLEVPVFACSPEQFPSILSNAFNRM